MIKNIDFEKYKKENNKLIQDFLISDKDKSRLGIVYTPINLVEKILELIPIDTFNKETKWLDIGAGLGNFSFIIYEKLYNLLNINNDNIIKNLYLSEIEEKQIFYLRNLFGENINLFNNFFDISEKYNSFFDVIVGNPPYNYGKIKTPTNKELNKKDEGKSIWQKFIIESLKLLKYGGFLSLIVPAIWLKPDKSGIYSLLTSYKIIKLNCLSNLETNKQFQYKAQTPTCYFLIQKTLSIENNILIYDDIYNKYINYRLINNYPIPMNYVSIINKFLKKVDKLGTLKVFKTNCLSSKNNLSTVKNEYYEYENISSCLLGGIKKLEPFKIKFYSNFPCQFAFDQKLILAHKMYGFPFFDDGNIGISSRDNYIIKDYSRKELIKIGKFLSCKTLVFIYSVTAYRMKYLEKYIFDFIPNISSEELFDDLPEDINERDKIIQEYFGLSDRENRMINSSVKNYKFLM